MLKAWLLVVSLCIGDGDCWSIVGDFDTEQQCDEFALAFGTLAREVRPDLPFLSECDNDNTIEHVVDARDMGGLALLQQAVPDEIL